MPALRAAISSQLAALSLRDEGELLAREQMVELLDSDGALSRYHYDPGHLTASGFVLNPSGTAFVLVDHPKIGKWLQPGGHVEPADQSLEAAARREITEETGLDDLQPLGMFDLDIHTFPAHGDQPTHLHFDVRFAFRAGSEDLDGGDHQAAWVPLDRTADWNDELSVLRPVAKLRQLVGERS